MKAPRALRAAALAVGAVVAAAAASPGLAAFMSLPDPGAVAGDAYTASGALAGPSPDHPLGVDEAGRDVLSRLLHGAPVTVALGLLAGTVSTAVGTLLGLAAGVSTGWVDAVISRFTDALLCFPVVLLALGVSAACSVGEGCAGGALRPGLPLVAVILAATTWGGCARAVRAQVRSLRAAPFVEAARALGASPARIAARELLPHVLGTVVVCLGFAVPGTMLLEGALALFGAGVPPPSVTWGGMLAGALPLLDSAPWAVAAPSAAIFLSACALARAAALARRGLGAAVDPWRTL